MPAAKGVPRKKMKIKSVRELYLRWTFAKNQVKQRSDAVCSTAPLKDNSIYYKQIDTYVEAACVIHERFTLGKEHLTDNEETLIKVMMGITCG